MAANNKVVIVQYQKALCVRGFHIYKEIHMYVWEAATDTVAVEKRGKLLDICYEVSQLCKFFSKERWNIHYTVTNTAVQFFIGLIVRCA